MKVDNNIPIPDGRTNNHHSAKYNFHLLKEHGNSIFIEIKNIAQINKIRTAAYGYAKYHGFKAVFRREEGGVRVWRKDDVMQG
jgi:hypothetical protein